MTDRLCVKCGCYYKEENWIVMKELHLSVCPTCLEYFKDKIVKEIQNDRT